MSQYSVYPFCYSSIVISIQSALYVLLPCLLKILCIRSLPPSLVFGNTNMSIYYVMVRCCTKFQSPIIYNNNWLVILLLVHRQWLSLSLPIISVSISLFIASRCRCSQIHTIYSLLSARALINFFRFLSSSSFIQFIIPFRLFPTYKQAV